MGSYFSYYDDDPLKIFEEAIKRLTNDYLEKYPDSAKSISYLKNKDVRSKAYCVLKEAKCDSYQISSRIQVNLDIPYFEMTVYFIKDGEAVDGVEMNFWPCSTCDCVSVKRLNKD